MIPNKPTVVLLMNALTSIIGTAYFVLLKKNIGTACKNKNWKYN